jgi:biopolymer transport protein ExbD
MRLVGPRRSVGLDAMPLIGVGLVLLVAVALLYPARMRQMPIEVPRRLHVCYVVADHYVPPTIVEVHADMTARVSVDHDVSIVPVIDLACTVYPLLAKNRTEPVVHVAFDDDVPWGDVVSTFDTLRGIRVRSEPTVVALYSRRD